MKNFKKLIVIATITFAIQQSMLAYDKSADDAQPTHQGWGRFGTFFENNLTLHPLNSVNALATGDQSDTTFGWHENDEGHIKANRAHTEHNNNKEINTVNDTTQRSTNSKRADKQTNNDQSTKTRGHWFWKSTPKDNSSSDKVVIQKSCNRDEDCTSNWCFYGTCASL